MDNIQGMAKLGKEVADLTVTSPPYDDLRNYKGYSFDFESTASGLYYVTKPGGVVVWVVGDATKNGSETGTSFKQALYFKEVGFNLHDTMIYAKNSYMPLTHRRYEQAFEYMFVFSKGKPKTFNPIMIDSLTAGSKKHRGNSKAKEASYSERKREEYTITNTQKQHSNIFYYDVGKNDKTEHNAPFPEQLAQDHILSWSNEGDLVFDPFMGSGTTAKMAKLNNRNFVGFEISQEYVDIANKRLGITQ
jgi:DNA modification methylase